MSRPVITLHPPPFIERIHEEMQTRVLPLVDDEAMAAPPRPATARKRASGATDSQRKRQKTLTALALEPPTVGAVPGGTQQDEHAASQRTCDKVNELMRIARAQVSSARSRPRPAAAAARASSSSSSSSGDNGAGGGGGGGGGGDVTETITSVEVVAPTTTTTPAPTPTPTRRPRASSITATEQCSVIGQLMSMFEQPQRDQFLPGFRQCCRYTAIQVFSVSGYDRMGARMKQGRMNDVERQELQDMDTVRMFRNRILASTMQNVNTAIAQQQEYEQNHQFEQAALPDSLNHVNLRVLLSMLMWNNCEHKATQVSGKSTCYVCHQMQRVRQSHALTFHRVEPGMITAREQEIVDDGGSIASATAAQRTSIFTLCDTCYSTVQSLQHVRYVFSLMKHELQQFHSNVYAPSVAHGESQTLLGFVQAIENNKQHCSQTRFNNFMEAMKRVVSDYAKFLQPLVADDNARLMGSAFNDMFALDDVRGNPLQQPVMVPTVEMSNLLQKIQMPEPERLQYQRMCCDVAAGQHIVRSNTLVK